MYGLFPRLGFTAGSLIFIVLPCSSIRSVALTALRCVVSKHLQVLDRDDFLPVCGESSSRNGSVGLPRLQWLLLDVVRFDAVFPVVGVSGFASLFERRRSFECLFVALCPSIYRFWIGMIFFPSAGFRSNTTGTLASVGSTGYCYASVSSGSGAWRSEFSGSYGCVSANLRTYAFSLRCVQAFTGSESG